MLARDTAKYVARRLRNGEAILWSGQPRRGMLLLKSDRFQIPFTSAWSGVALIFLFLSPPDPLGIAVDVLLAICVFHVCIGRFLLDAYKRKHTQYAVTNQRVLIVVHTILAKRFESIPHDDQHQLTLADNGNGTGSVYFGTPHWLELLLFAPNTPLADLYLPPYLYCIDQPQAVIDLLRAQRDPD